MSPRRGDRVRRAAGPVPRELIESFAGSRIDRRDVVRIGLTLGMTSVTPAACDGADDIGTTADPLIVARTRRPRRTEGLGEITEPPLAQVQRHQSGRCDLPVEGPLRLRSAVP